MNRKPCNKCGRPIEWVLANGSWIPLDPGVVMRHGADPPPAGTYYDAQGTAYESDEVPCKTKVRQRHWDNCR